MDPSLKFIAPSVSVVIPVYNQSHLTRRCLESLFGHSIVLKDVFVINNGSRDATEAVLREFQERVGRCLTVITNPDNAGFGRAMNQGLRLATGEHLVCLNNDTWVMPGWDRALVEELERHRLDVIAPYFYEGPWSSEDEMKARAAGFTSRNRDRARDHFAAILFLLRREAFERLRIPEHGGLFDERFFVTYEDTDLLRRMRDAGVRYGQTGASFVWHQSMASRSAPGALPSQYEQEGLKRFIEKWGYDPRPADHTWGARLRRRWWKIREKRGLF